MNQLATFAAGCFWRVEAKFSSLDGVQETSVGFMGGTIREPTYEEVSNHTTGHAEVVQVSYNPEKISYEQLLSTFWEIHESISDKQQDQNRGSQYRSVIFHHNDTQKIEAEQSKLLMRKSAIPPHSDTTTIIPVSTFWRAEEEHQQYFAKHSIGT
ncbi:peptide-methionine (S)-S-oxide reductase MsrA [Neptunomonas sp.]|uniref:peptide-methionine (S)-S-oxide reductase MsrA n=1 Tax=Neptunomonas sp. TaxID=1971898 RepID=UPI0025F4A6BF|nr:peptide-methionine (S)-S-oxide reductase MsrA [Neptunomonas sp.]